MGDPTIVTGTDDATSGAHPRDRSIEGSARPLAEDAG